jgi:hypothetical protein
MRIKLIGTRNDKAHGFYELMLKFSLSSDELDEFIIHAPRKEIIKVLKKFKVKYKEL